MQPSKHTNKVGTYWTYHSPTLPPIVMIHGFRGTHHGLDLIARALTDYYVIVPDLPGFGEATPLNNGHTLENYTQWLHAFMVSLNLAEPVILLGHSFGSIVASHYAAMYPKTISKLVLVNPIGAPALEGPKAILTKLAILYYWLGRKLPPKAAHRWLAAKPVVMIMSITMVKTNDKAKRRYIHNQHLAHFSTFANAMSLSESFQTSVSNNVRDHAKHIITPTLLIAGDKDDITPLVKQQALQTLFPNAQLKVIKNVGHLTHYETPDQVAKLVKEFL